MTSLNLIVNSGSSSLKLSIFELFQANKVKLIQERTFKLIAESDNHQQEITDHLNSFLSEINLDDLKLISHRIVHGGRFYHEPVIIDEKVNKDIKDLAKFAPLHNLLAVYAIESLKIKLPQSIQLAFFDTAFFANLPLAAKLYALPISFYNDLHIERYGFHGINHEYCYHKIKDYYKHCPAKIVIAHLGAGASLSAIKDNQCLDTTMGFTPLDGLTMATRSGSLDPGIITYLLQEKYSLNQLNHILNFESGLKGLSGITGNFQELIKLTHQGNESAKLALDIFVHNLKKYILAMVASLDGLDCLVFTGGIGENSAYLRQRITDELAFLKIKIKRSENVKLKLNSAGLKNIAKKSSKIKFLVVNANENLAIALKSIPFLMNYS